jgi:hypothetical protein
MLLPKEPGSKLELLFLSFTTVFSEVNTFLIITYGLFSVRINENQVFLSKRLMYSIVIIVQVSA